MPLSGRLLAKTMRRICDSAHGEFLNEAVDFLGSLPVEAAPLALAGISGLIEGQKGKVLPPGRLASEVLAKLSSSPNRELAARAQELGALWGDAAAMRAALKLADDPRANPDERVKAIQVVRRLKNDETRDAMLQLVARVKDKPAGFFLGFELKPDTFFAWFYGVLPEARRMGIGSQLMEAAQSWAAQHNYETIRLECHNSHRPMLHLAIELGYDIVGLHWDADRGDNLIMFEKNLTGR